MDIVCNVYYVNVLCHFVYLCHTDYTYMQMFYSLILVYSNVTFVIDFHLVESR